MTGLKEKQLFDSFSDKEYRDAFVEEHITSGLARQIRAIREKNGWTQQELAERTGKAQETISQLENPDYGRFTLRTLKTLASAFDLALLVNFVSFRELTDRVSNLSPETIAPPNYEEERQMSFSEMTSGSSEWKPPTAAPTSGTVFLLDASTAYIIQGSPSITRVGHMVDSTGDEITFRPLERAEAGERRRELAAAAD